MDDIEIRSFDISEINVCGQLFHDAFNINNPNVIPYITNQWKVLLKKEIINFLVAVSKKKIIGFGGLYLFDQSAWIGCMSVQKDYQRRRIGESLFKDLVNIAETNNISTIELYATKKGEGLYRKFGFIREYHACTYTMDDHYESIDDNVTIHDDLPEWIVSFDKDNVGFDRKPLLEAYIELGAKILTCKLGYAILFGDRLGSIVSTDINTAIELIINGRKEGAGELLLVEGNPVFQDIVKKLNLKRNNYKENVKMYLGKKPNLIVKNYYGAISYACG
ncbi:MAG: GNAT family N-acetyltransferase [Candidatus Hodarchaeales archaeon]|jgi:N-acetylglutamate synthase-like GNAT family acetyltransferase